jgi:hypothetical protein
MDFLEKIRQELMTMKYNVECCHCLPINAVPFVKDCQCRSK